MLQELLSSEQQVLLLCRQLEDLPPDVSHVLALEDGHVLQSGRKSDVLASDAVHLLLNPPATPMAALPPPAPRPYTIPPDQPLLQLRGVDVSYGDLAVLQGVDWTFEHGQHCAISGPNGCGKSTLLSLVTGDNHKAYGQDIILFGIKLSLIHI